MLESEVKFFLSCSIFLKRIFSTFILWPLASPIFMVMVVFDFHPSLAPLVSVLNSPWKVRFPTLPNSIGSQILNRYHSSKADQQEWRANTVLADQYSTVFGAVRFWNGHQNRRWRRYPSKRFKGENLPLVGSKKSRKSLLLWTLSAVLNRFHPLKEPVMPGSRLNNLLTTDDSKYSR